MTHSSNLSRSTGYVLNTYGSGTLVIFKVYSVFSDSVKLLAILESSQYFASKHRRYTQYFRKAILSVDTCVYAMFLVRARTGTEYLLWYWRRSILSQYTVYVLYCDGHCNFLLFHYVYYKSKFRCWYSFTIEYYIQVKFEVSRIMSR